MAFKTLTTGIITLTTDTVSADTDDAAGGEAPTGAGSADGWLLPYSAYKGGNILLKFFDPTGGSAVVVLAGDNPPAIRAGLGNLAITLASADVQYVVIDPTRFMQNDGSIMAYSDQTDTRLTVFVLPKGP
jgi:hypothetical protein